MDPREGAAYSIKGLDGAPIPAYVNPMSGPGDLTSHGDLTRGSIWGMEEGVVIVVSKTPITRLSQNVGPFHGPRTANSTPPEAVATVVSSSFHVWPLVLSLPVAYLQRVRL